MVKVALSGDDMLAVALPWPYHAGMSHKPYDFTGQRFGKLEALRLHDKTEWGYRWWCRCDCGNEKPVLRTNLMRSKSCGCMIIPGIKAAQTTHGMSNTKLYGVWRGMMRRCGDPGDKSYSAYGGRGIRVCKPWHLFESFRDDMGANYAEGMSIERVNVNGIYSPRNCVWLPVAEQYKNRRHHSEWRTPGRINPTGQKGVYRTRSGKWAAILILPHKTRRQIGSFDTPKAAAAAYKRAFAELVAAK